MNYAPLEAAGKFFNAYPWIFDAGTLVTTIVLTFTTIYSVLVARNLLREAFLTRHQSTQAVIVLEIKSLKIEDPEGCLTLKCFLEVANIGRVPAYKLACNVCINGLINGKLNGISTKYWHDDLSLLPGESFAIDCEISTTTDFKFIINDIHTKVIEVRAEWKDILGIYQTISEFSSILRIFSGKNDYLLGRYLELPPIGEILFRWRKRAWNR